MNNYLKYNFKYLNNNYQKGDSFVSEINHSEKLPESPPILSQFHPILPESRPILPESRPILPESLTILLDASPKTKIQLVESELKKFGLRKLRLVDNNSINLYFDLMTNVVKLLDYVNVFRYINNNKYELTYLNSSNVEEKKIFTRGKNKGKGSYNNIFECTDDNGKQYILRLSNSETLADQKEAFYENIKHCILYILIRSYIGNIKFIPQVYYIGLRITSKDAFETFCIIEKGENTLEKYIIGESLTNTQKVFLRIYNALFLIEDILKINFKHNDLKYDNILITAEGKPLIIDFGFSTFNLEGIEFKSLYRDHRHQYYDNVKYFGYNIVYDIIFLMLSLYWTSYEEPLKIFSFKKNKKSNILDSEILIEYLNVVSDKKSVMLRIYDKLGNFKNVTLNKDSFSKKKSELDFNQLEIIKKIYNHMYNDIFFDLLIVPKEISIFINPFVLADNLDLSIPTKDDYDKFERKYRKYKAKYLALRRRASI